MSAAEVSSSPANHDRPLLHPSPLLSDQRSGVNNRMRTLLDLLTIEKMDGLDQSLMRSSAAGSRWRFLKERLGLNLMVSCCGITKWQDNFDNNDINTNSDNNIIIIQEGANEEVGSTGGGGMNLAAALAAERQFRAAVGEEGSDQIVATPRRVSLMRLLEETETVETTESGNLKGGEVEEKVESSNENIMCCVCMERKKGAAFIPCGHTYCRVCSRELWLNRGSCPLCNRRILEILDIF